MKTKIVFIIELEVSEREPSIAEMADLNVIVDANAAEFVNETAGLVFGDYASYTRNTVAVTRIQTEA